MAQVPATWIGAKQLINIPRVRVLGAWYVAEYRIRNMSKWLGSIFAFGLGNPILLLLSIGIGIGSLVDKGTGGNGIDGVPYLVFLAPALLATSAIQAAMDETTFPTLDGFVWSKSFFGMNSTQLTANSIIGGVLIASAARCVLNSVLFAAVLWAFGAIDPLTIPALLIAGIFSGMSFAAVMLAVSARIKDDDGFFALVGRFILTPMFMFSGTYYPLETLPIYLQWIGWISPVWHATNLGRVLSYGHAIEPMLLATHLLYMTVLLVVGWALASRTFTKRLLA